jgi:hypothetical protein
LPAASRIDTESFIIRRALSGCGGGSMVAV